MKAKEERILKKTALFMAALIWGSTFVVVKNAVDNIPPNLLLAIRFTLGSLILGTIFWKRLKKMTKEDLVAGIIIGICLFSAYCSQTIGITDTTPGKNAFLTAVYCVIVPFLYWFVDRVKPGGSRIFAAVICIVGIGLVSLTDGLSIRMGDALTLLGGFLYAVHIVAIVKCGKGKDPVVLTILQFATAAVLSWIVTLTFETMPQTAVWNVNVVFGILYLAVFGTTIAMLLQNVGQKGTNPSAAAILLSLESVFGVLFSVLLYEERPTMQMIIGFVLIFVAVLVSELAPSKGKGEGK